MHSLWKRRFTIFKNNKRAFYSLILFICFFTLTLGSEFVANDKPLIISYNNSFYFPIFKTYPETVFGGQFETSPNYHDPVLKQLITTNGWMLWAPIQYNYNSINFEMEAPFPAAPNFSNWLGTDDGGHDILAGILYGSRICIIFGLILTFFSSVIGVSIGAIQGYYGGKIDLLGQRFIEIISGLPTLFLLIILSSFVEPNFWWLLLITVIFGWIAFVGMVRAEFLRARNLEYVVAAKALGIKNSIIILRHMLPNAMVATLTILPFALSGAIVTLTSLDFLGFGLPAGSASLGALLAQGKNNLQAPWIGISVFVVLSIILSLLVFIGEGVRDAFDPRYVEQSK